MRKPYRVGGAADPVRIGRVRGPVGLFSGAKSAPEVATPNFAEIMQIEWGANRSYLEFGWPHQRPMKSAQRLVRWGWPRFVPVRGLEALRGYRYEKVNLARRPPCRGSVTERGANELSEAAARKAASRRERGSAPSRA